MTETLSEKVEVIKHRRGLRSVAIFEAAKGGLVLAAGAGLLSFLHRDLQRAGVRLIHTLHLNPANHYPSIFLEALSHVTSTNLVLLAIGAAAYSVLRFAEAYGLWYGRPWAEWLAIVSGGLYLPVEVYELFRHYTYIKLAVTIGNLALVIYLLSLRFPHIVNKFKRS